MSDSNEGGLCGCLGFLAIILVILLVVAIVKWTTVRTFDGTVVSKEVEGGNTYFSLLQDGESKPELFANDDSLFNWKFNSRDFLVTLKVGERYRFKVNWFRAPFLWQSRNILKATPL